MVHWFAILMAVNLQTSFLTPPFGFALFYLKGIAPKEVKIHASGLRSRQHEDSSATANSK